MFSNSPHISKLSLGSLRGWKSENNQGKKPCRSYIGKDGKRKFNGTRHLKKNGETCLMVEVGVMGIYGILLAIEVDMSCIHWVTLEKIKHG